VPPQTTRLSILIQSDAVDPIPSAGQQFAGYDELAVPAPLELAQHLVFGAVEFARKLGFEPHPDFATAADHLGTWPGHCPIEFGYKGSPFYIQGPYDDVEAIANTLAGPPAGQTPGLNLKLNAALAMR
jgi:hypothetical protein